MSNTMKEIKQAQREEKENFAAFCRRVKKVIKDQGIRAAELQLEFIKSRPSLRTKSTGLSHSQVLDCYEQVIADYRKENSHE